MKFPNPITFAGAVGRVLWAWLHRRQILVPPKIEEQRRYCCLNTCSFCDRNDRQCLECTCFIDLKCPLATEKCPRGYWKRYWGPALTNPAKPELKK